MVDKTKVIKKTIAWLSLAVVLLYVITGYGITKEELVSKASLGVLTKSVSFSIHKNLIYPLIIFVLAHLFLALNLQEKFKREEELNNL